MSADSADAAVQLVRSRLAAGLGAGVFGELDLRTVPGPADEPDTDDDEPDDSMPLSWVRTPVDWDAFSVSEDERFLRIHYIQAGSVQGPGAAIAEVVLSELGSTVSVLLVERELAGTYPNGAHAGRKMVAVGGCLQVRLEAPLGRRRVIDASTGLPAARLAPDAPSVRAALERGCPIWLSAASDIEGSGQRH